MDTDGLPMRWPPEADEYADRGVNLEYELDYNFDRVAVIRIETTRHTIAQATLLRDRITAALKEAKRRGLK